MNIYYIFILIYHNLVEEQALQNFINSLPTEDRLPLELSKLYEQFGYQKYCMSKFEEYGFYSDNRDFLSTDGIIAFNNSAGKLMALKPDITLSIVKNARTLPHTNARYYYGENVYRISEDTHDCKEIKQCGIELLGDIDSHATAEIVLLALKSLEKIDSNFTLIISHIAFVSSALEDAGIIGEKRRMILSFIKRKNRHDLIRWCSENGVDEQITNRLIKISSISGSLSDVLPTLKELITGDKTANAYNELLNLYNALNELDIYKNLRLDLSVLNHLDYYNGILLQGYVKNASAPVLSGGRYDNLAKKIRGDGGAFGFAVYLDGLNLHYPNKGEFDCDAVIIYEQSDTNLLSTVNDMCQKGKKVRVEHKIPEGIKAKKIFKYENGILTEVAE